MHHGEHNQRLFSNLLTYPEVKLSACIYHTHTHPHPFLLANGVLPERSALEEDGTRYGELRAGTSLALARCTSAPRRVQVHCHPIAQVSGHGRILQLWNSDQIQTRLQRHPWGGRWFCKSHGRRGRGDSHLQMQAREAWMGQRHRRTHHALPAQPQSTERLPQSKGRWYKALGFFIHHPTTSQLPVALLPGGCVST